MRDAAVIEALQRVVAAHPRWSFWKCHDRLRLDGHGWNHKRAYRVYRALRLHLLFSVKHFCRSTSTILAGSDGRFLDDARGGRGGGPAGVRPVRRALLRVL